MRKLLITLLSMIVLMPASALALGLGNITLHSALNEPLNAEIELLSVAPGEIDSLRVGLADAQTFSRLGIERASQLMLLNFEVEEKRSGEYVVKVTSRETMREPFLTLLLDARWDAGRLVREYTLLLDPPLTHAERAPAPTAPVTAATPSAAPAPTPVRPATPRPAAPRSGELSYGPVQANDTLWGIAQQMRPSDDISVQQMMMALFEANPYAFIDGNINRLKAGYVLRIDDPDLLRAMSRAEAAREVTRHTNEWRERREAAAERAEERVSPEVADETTDPATVATAPRAEPELTLVTPDDRAEAERDAAARTGAEDQTVAAVRQDLMLALESSAAQRQENEELRKRIQAMEEQLGDMERMLTLKSSDLAQLQQQLREHGAEVELASEAAPGEVAPPVAEAEPTVSEPVTEAEPSVSEAAPAPAVSEAPREERPARPAPPPAPAPSMMDKIFGEPMLLAVAGGVIVVLLLLGMLIVRRRRKGSSFQESILTAGSSSMMEAKASEGKETSFLSDLAISGMGAGAAQGDEGEVDPLTEADVFIAYGRNQQAEEVLKKALEETPQRLELTAKLLEVYYNTRDTDAFAKLAEESAEQLQTQEALWATVAGMGRELLPDNELFASVESAEPPAAEKKPAAPISDDVLDIGLDLDELTAEMESEGEGDSDFADFDLDLSAFDEDDKKGQGSVEDATPEDMSAEAASESVADTGDVGELELDLDTLGEDETPVASAQTDESQAEEQGVDEFSLELDALDDSAVADGDEASAAEPTADDGFGELDLDQELESLGAKLEEQPSDEPTGSDEFDLGELDMGDLDAELDSLDDSALEEAPAVEETPASDEFDLDVSSEADDLTGLDDLENDMLDDGDEITTKLDLAQAYVEMGDGEGARSMLEEVVEAGNEEQKQQAQELLDKI